MNHYREVIKGRERERGRKNRGRKRKEDRGEIKKALESIW